MVRSKVKLLINGRFLTQNPTGVQNYALGIVKALIKSGIEIEIICPPGKISHPELPVKHIGFSGGFIWEQVFLAFYVRKQKNVLLLNLCNSASLFIKQQAVTIHDLAFEEENNWFNPMFKLWYRFMIPRICKRAQSIFTVSEFSKKKISNTYGISESKIILAPPGIPEFIFENKLPDYGNYVILTGVNNPRKNAHWVLEHIESLIKSGFKIIALGKNSRTFQSISIENHESVIFFNHVSFSIYCSLLKNAKALIYPSFYEGFGIPVLESLCLGTPVIASDISVFKTIYGDIPIYFRIDNEDSFSSAVAALSGKQISKEDIDNLKNKYNFESSAANITGVINTIV